MSKRIVILGAGESGAGAAVLAKKNGCEVFVSDMGIIKPKYKDLLNKYAIEWEESKHSMDLILNADEVIKSPGIADKTEVIKKLKEKNIPIISEIEYAGRFTQAKKICITGSNGKTTTTTLIYHIFKKAGLNVALAGNIGKSFALQVAEDKYDYYVIELSSFQLDNMYQFKADIAILLNITPDHLDRYNYNIDNYAASKCRITQNQLASDYFIYCSDDEITMKELKKIKIQAKELPFSIQQTTNQTAYLSNHKMIITMNNFDFSISIDELALKGKHNICNSMAASISASACDIKKDVIRESLIDFQGVEHRLENFIKVRGIEFVNDSKATNVNSVWYALESISKPIVLIAGGVDKGNDYSSLTELVRTKVRAIVCLGKDNKKIIDSFKDVVKDIVETMSMEDAVRKSYYLAKEGDVVLLSPACASFDLFENYEDRGRQFKECVRNL